MNVYKKQQHSHGFTLIELLVVIAIIGILASLVLVALGDARDKANASHIRSGLGQLRTMAEIYYDSNAASYLDFDTCVITPNSTNCVGDVENSIDTIITDMQNSAATAGALHLEVAANATDFCVSVSLPPDTSNALCIDASGQFLESTLRQCSIGGAVYTCP